jgi:hypothetical protein
MYGPEAQALRRCLGVRKDGQPCGCYGVWDDDDQLCFTHAGRHHTGPILPRPYWGSTPARYIPCTCIAYAWPHRPGGGLCRWPEQPVYRSLRRAGTRAYRLRGPDTSFRVLERRWAEERREIARALERHRK